MEQRAIDSIIIKLIENRISEEESVLLLEWMEVAENKTYFDEFVETSYLIHSKNSFDYSDSLKKAQKKIHRKKGFRQVEFLKYAAIFLVLLSIAIPLYQNKVPSESTKEKKVLISSLLPKYNNPTLILADGTVVSLEPKKEKIVSQNGIITNVNQVLAYNTKISKETNPFAENTLLVPVGGIYAVTLSDGTKVWLNSKSSLKYPVHFSGDKRTVTLEGEAYFEVSKDPHNPFTVKTQSGNITVLGTHFNVSSYSDDDTFATTLVEGKVEVSDFGNSSQKASVILKPNQQAIINGGSVSPKVVQVDSEIYTAWKEGKFYFENESLKGILNKMGRWYNFNIHFEEKSLEKIKFTGSVLKNEPLEHFLEIIKKSSGVKYKMTKTNQAYEVSLSK